MARQKHQQQVLEGITDKLMSKTILTKYNSILNKNKEVIFAIIDTIYQKKNCKNCKSKKEYRHKLMVW